MGLSCKHASTVPLVLNHDTLVITPQYHVVYDDWFTSEVSQDHNAPFSDQQWAELFQGSRYQHHFDDEHPIELDAQWNVDSAQALE